MLTPQEVSTHAFTKAVMGGYNMAMVDEFLDELTDDYTALYKENAALKAKMKVLVEKVEEYRATEDSMRATLLTAQRMADSIVKEAEAKRDAILAEAKSGAEEKAYTYQKELAEAEGIFHHGAGAGPESFDEPQLVISVGRHIGGETVGVLIDKLFLIHREQGTVQIEENCGDGQGDHPFHRKCIRKPV